MCNNLPLPTQFFANNLILATTIWNHIYIRKSIFIYFYDWIRLIKYVPSYLVNDIKINSFRIIAIITNNPAIESIEKCLLLKHLNEPLLNLHNYPIYLTSTSKINLCKAAPGNRCSLERFTRLSTRHSLRLWLRGRALSWTADNRSDLC